MFANIDTDNSGTITYEELKEGLAKLGSKLTEAEVKQLMDAVSWSKTPFLYFHFLRKLIKCKISYSRDCDYIRLMLMGMDQSTT